MHQIARPTPAARHFTALALLATTLLMSPAQAEEIYKWVNENNEIQYTQTRPAAGIEVEVIKSRQRPLQAASQPETAAAQVADEAPDSTEDEPLATDAEQPQRDAEIARVMQQNCLNARKNLEVLSRGGKTQYMTSDGKVVRLSEEQRQQRIDEANEQIRLLCKG